MRYLRLALLTFVAFFAAATAAQDVGYLDLTDPVSRQRIRLPGLTGFGTSCILHSPDGSEIAVTLLSLDKEFYSMEDYVTFEVRVQNSGLPSIYIPWTPHSAEIEPSSPTVSYTYRKATVILTFVDPDSQLAFSLFSHSYGSTDVPGTLRELQPGQWVVIRGRERLHELYDNGLRRKIWEAQPLKLKVRAGFLISNVTYSPNEKEGAAENSECASWQPRKSNQLDVALWPERYTSPAITY